MSADYLKKILIAVAETKRRFTENKTITISSQNELRVTINIYIRGDEILITKMSEEI